jgi:hypothetical protein
LRRDNGVIFASSDPRANAVFLSFPRLEPCSKRMIASLQQIGPTIGAPSPMDAVGIKVWKREN